MHIFRGNAHTSISTIGYAALLPSPYPTTSHFFQEPTLSRYTLPLQFHTFQSLQTSSQILPLQTPEPTASPILPPRSYSYIPHTLPCSDPALTTHLSKPSHFFQTLPSQPHFKISFFITGKQTFLETNMMPVYALKQVKLRTPQRTRHLDTSGFAIHRHGSRIHSHGLLIHHHQTP